MKRRGFLKRLFGAGVGIAAMATVPEPRMEVLKQDYAGSLTIKWETVAKLIFIRHEIQKTI